MCIRDSSACAEAENQSPNMVENIILPTQSPLDPISKDPIPTQIIDEEKEITRNFERKILPTISKSSDSSKYREAYVYNTPTSTPTPTSPDVFIPDINLEKIIRFEINKIDGNITERDMQKLNSLSGSGRGISDLTGIEFAYNITSLDLPNNQILNLNVPDSRATPNIYMSS